jgi:outer membrane protein
MIMKKLIMLVTALSFFSLTVLEGQINQGRMLIGVATSINYMSFGSDLMNLGFTTVKQKSNAPGYVEPDAEKTTTINLLPRVGYFIIDNLVVGLDLSVSSYTAKYSSDSKSTMTYLGVGPFVRYYIPGTSVMPFFEIGGLFGSLNEKYTSASYSDSYKYGMMSIGGGAGISVKLCEKVAFDIMAGYNSMTEKAKENNENDVRTVYGTLGVKLGFVCILGGK